MADNERTAHTPGNAPLVSAILPIYNAEPYLNQALASVRHQTLSDIEIICVSDGSTDGSLPIMKGHAAADRRVRVIDKSNGGYGSACNCGLDEARGTYVAVVEPDDWIEPGMFKSLLDCALGFDEPVDIVKSPYWRIVDPDTPGERRINCSYRGRIKPTAQPFDIHNAGANHLLRHHPSIWSALYRRAFLADAGIRFREIPGAGWADNPFFYETLLDARTIAYLDTPFYCYREEGADKAARFARTSTLVPFERMDDLFGIVEAREVSDPLILQAVYARGFTYLAGVLDYVSLEADEGLRNAVERMFSRMDDALVFSEPTIEPALKALYARLKGVTAPRTAKIPYWGFLAREFAYSARNLGPAETFGRLTGFLHRR